MSNYLLSAILQESPDRVASNLNEDVNKVFKNGFTPLTLACAEHNIPIIKLLIRSGADINKPSSDGRRPIDWAILSGDKKTVEFMLRLRCSNKPNYDLISGSEFRPEVVEAINKRVA
jgi:ankyrin repeat protein